MNAMYSTPFSTVKGGQQSIVFTSAAIVFATALFIHLLFLSGSTTIDYPGNLTQSHAEREIIKMPSTKVSHIVLII
jgi:hypothetical protein